MNLERSEFATFFFCQFSFLQFSHPDFDLEHYICLACRNISYHRKAVQESYLGSWNSSSNSAI